MRAAVVAVAASVVACDCGGEPATTCETSAECGAGETCRDRRCVPRADGSTDADVPDAGPSGVACAPDGTCENDSRCVEGRCIGWGAGETDPTCTRAAVPGPVRPALQCVWSGPPEGDPVPTYRYVLHTPLVATLGIPTDPDSPPRPSVVFISDATYAEGVPRTCEAAGVLRAIDGATCRDQAIAGDPADRVNSSVTPAIGDIDADGRPEIVAAAAAGGVIAFRYDGASGALVRVWRSHTPEGADDLHGSTTCLWGGISLYDLDDDGLAETIFEGAVYGPDGTRIATVPGWIGYPWGNAAAVANIDDDPAPELVGGEGVWQWDATARTFVLEGADSGARGFTAIADFGELPAAGGAEAGTPEIVVVGDGRVRVINRAGTILFDMASSSAVGGPPTIADYDGDGVPEIGAAFAATYAVFDVVEGRILWEQPSQDASSARTGSSVFDFNGDGRADVVYGDECYVRIYEGSTGEVVFSQARFSSTWEENPIVADVDGDASAEIVMGTSGACVPAYCPQLDPIFAGLPCEGDVDCPSGRCDAGLCRCDSDAECGASYACADPLAGSPGTGRVCRAQHLDCDAGLRIYRDAHDRWAASRTIWNQHAYHVTNVEEDGTIPRTSAAMRNWEVAGLNNFRQNVQGGLGTAPGADLTVGRLAAICEGEGTRLTAEVCSRGPTLIDSGVEVIFRQVGGDELCRIRTTEPIPAGACREVSCVAPVRAEGAFEAIADPDAVIAECVEPNNRATGEANCVL